MKLGPGSRTRRDTAGPFRAPLNSRALYKLGFNFEEEMVLIEGEDIGTAHVPDWAKSPNAGVIGTWKITRRRLRLKGIPLTPWVSV